ncbi:hypothetical protein Q7P37_007435 [Cladosporium fusiforme]
MFQYIATFALLTASATAAPLLVVRSASQGCGKSHTSGYNGPFTINSGGRDRSYKVQVPSNYNSNEPYPLIFDFANGSIHGRGGTHDSQRETSKYYDYNSASQYVIVYPQATSGDEGAAWEGPSYANKDVDDVEFISDLLDQFKSNYCIDTDRVYASGKSNGGGFVDVLACSNTGDQFAAFAMAAAAFYTDLSKSSCNKKRAILESHGDSDNTIPYSGGQGLGGQLPAIGDWVRFWGERNCGTGAPSSRSNKDGYHITTFSCGYGNSVVTHYHLYEPAAHCWPATGSNDDSKRIPNGCGDSKVLDFTPVVLNWFGQWSLKNAPS